jgi:hypothetical protein
MRCAKSIGPWCLCRLRARHGSAAGVRVADRPGPEGTDGSGDLATDQHGWRCLPVAPGRAGRGPWLGRGAAVRGADDKGRGGTRTRQGRERTSHPDGRGSAVTVSNGGSREKTWHQWEQMTPRREQTPGRRRSHVWVRCHGWPGARSCARPFQGQAGRPARPPGRDWPGAGEGHKKGQATGIRCQAHRIAPVICTPSATGAKAVSPADSLSS